MTFECEVSDTGFRRYDAPLQMLTDLILWKFGLLSASDKGYVICPAKHLGDSHPCIEVCLATSVSARKEQSDLALMTREGGPRETLSSHGSELKTASRISIRKGWLSAWAHTTEPCVKTDGKAATILIEGNRQ